MRILVVEDDATSRRFLDDALLLAGHEVSCCADMAAAVAASAAVRFDLVLTDLSLPDGGGERFFRLLREDPASPNHATAVVALSAGLSPDARARLRRLGFAGALEKPMAMAALERIVQGQHPGVEDSGASPPWEGAIADIAPAPRDSSMLQDLDDAAGLAVTGSTEILAGLRDLFRAELPLQLELVGRAVANDDRESLRAALHRLAASCGFCGAAALKDAVRRLETTLLEHDSIPAAQVAALHDAGKRCLRRLHSQA